MAGGYGNSVALIRALEDNAFQTVAQLAEASSLHKRTVQVWLRHFIAGSLIKKKQGAVYVRAGYGSRTGVQLRPVTYYWWHVKSEPHLRRDGTPV